MKLAETVFNFLSEEVPHFNDGMNSDAGFIGLPRYITTNAL
ncbi:MAG: hypothetical protein AAFR77_16110 [Cyanobacteria bacterium J06631_2]